SEVFNGPVGLLAVRVRYSKEDSSLYLYDQSGKQLSKIDSLKSTDYSYGDLIWLSGLDKPYLSCFYCDAKLDPQTGENSPLDGSPELYSPLAPDKLSLYYGADSGTESNTTWVIAFNGKQVGKFSSVRPSQLSDIGISPDGMFVSAANYAGQGTTAGVIIFE